MSARGTDQLSLWQRFHVRLGLTYGALVLLVLTAMAWMMFQVGVDAARAGVNAHIRGVAIALASSLPADAIGQIEGPDSPAYAPLRRTLQAVLDAEPEIASVYVFLPTDEPGWLRFAGDVVRHGEPGRPGERYDATQAPAMLAGLKGPSVESAPYTDPWGTFLSGYAPLSDAQGAVVGLVGVDIQIAQIKELEGRLLRITALLYAVSVAALALVGVGVGRNLRGPLERLIAATSAVDAGELRVRTTLKRDDEFGILGAHFDHMAAGLEEKELIADTFGRFVSREVARQILSGPEAARLGGDLREVTVLFSDVRGYSTLSERLPPEKVVSLMNEYFGAMSEIIEAHGGTIIEFLGDGILAAFGAPARLPDHATAAVRAAVAMRARLVELNAGWEADGVARLWRDLGLGPLGARIGVHTGTVIAGNLGSKRRMKYAVIGDPVNVASRVEGLNKVLGTELLFTGAVFERLSPELAARAQDLGEQPVKGRAGVVRVYTIGQA